ncbi:MAG: hypothetical protein K8I00_06640, partial [Candidatus Omnitrophica bacterium]|nr:hypothetical protein [Candidatus Omnitrophota bacterium]
MRLNSIRFKASILYSAILAVILSLFSSVIYISIHNILYHDLDQELKIKSEEISSILYAYNQIERGRSHRLNSILELLQSESAAAEQRVVIDDLWRSQLEVLNLKNDYINIINRKGQTIFSSFNLNSDVAAL